MKMNENSVLKFYDCWDCVDLVPVLLLKCVPNLFARLKLLTKFGKLSPCDVTSNVTDSGQALALNPATTKLMPNL